MLPRKGAPCPKSPGSCCEAARGGQQEVETLASVSDNSTLRFWNVRNRQELLSIRRSAGLTREILFSPDGNWLAGKTSGGLRLLDPSREPHARTSDPGGRWPDATTGGFAPDSALAMSPGRITIPDVGNQAMKTKASILRAKPVVGMLASAMVLSSALAGDWPQYLGPTRNSLSPEKGILRAWPEKGPEVLWTAAVSRGYGGPAVQAGKVYLLDRDDKVGDKLRCLDFATGKDLWSFAYDAPGTVMFPGSRSVPTLDGKHVYTCGHNGDLYCVDIQTRKPVWNKNVWKDFGGDRIPFWAITQCPLVFGDLLIVASQAPEAGVVAYDKLTGDLKWKTPPLGLISYASPSVVKVDGQDHVVMVTSSTNPFQRTSPIDELGNIVGIEPLTGAILWKFEKWECHIPVASAVDAGDNQVLLAGGYELGALLIKVEKKPDGTYGATEVFRTREFGDQTKPPLVYKRHFYAQYGTNNRRDGMACMSLTGEILWKTKRSPDFNKGSMILADGLILASDGARSLYLIEPDPAGYKQLASVELFPEGAAGSSENDIASRVGGRNQNWAPMALADGKLLIRDVTQLKCVRVAQ